MGSRRSSELLRWWWSIDSLVFMLTIALIAIGAMLTTAASPAVAERIGVGQLYFINKQIIFLILAVLIIIALSTFSKSIIKNTSIISFLIFICLLIAVLFIGNEAKGAKRWLNILGFSLQPSEILKPFYAVFIGHILAEGKKKSHIPSLRICFIVHFIVASLLLLQPDFGMTVTISMVAISQFFIAGMSIFWLIVLFVLFTSGVIASYMILPHVAKRVDSFLSLDDNSNYQVMKSLESHIEGGFLGKGPGEGDVKMVLPDAHTDFIFAVAGEELGAIFCIILIILFASVVVMGLIRTSKNEDLFCIYSSFGVLMYLAIQSAFNIGVTLNLFPTKGVTLPFISYGGSSVLSCAISIGIYLSLTKMRQTIHSRYVRRIS